MPRTKSLSHYPTRYQEMIRECAVKGLRIEVALPTVKQALSLRGHWYAFMGSLKVEGRRLEELQGKRILSTGEADMLDLYKMSPLVMVQVDAGINGISPMVIYQSRENSWQAQAMAGATKIQQSPAPTSTAAVSMADQLLAIQQEKDHGPNG